MRQYRYSIVAGDVLALRLRRKSATGNIDMTGSKCRIGFKWPGGFYEIDETNGVTLSTETDAVTGFINSLISAKIPSETTIQFPRGRLTSYQVQVEDAAGVVTTLLGGSVDVEMSAFMESPIDV